MEEPPLPKDSFCDCCLTDRLRESGCSVRLPPPPHRKVVSGTKYRDNHNLYSKLCDGLILWMHPSVGYSFAAVEMKGGSLSAKSVVDQLQEGAKIAEKFISAEKITFGAILFKRSRMHPIEVKVLSQKRILFRNKGYRVFVARCGSDLNSSGPWSV